MGMDGQRPVPCLQGRIPIAQRIKYQAKAGECPEVTRFQGQYPFDVTYRTGVVAQQVENRGPFVPAFGVGPVEIQRELMTAEQA